MRETVLIMPVYGKPQTTDRCLESLFKCAKNNPPFSVVVIDDGSDPVTKECLSKYSINLLTNCTNRGYIYSVNRGIGVALDELNAEYIVLMNNDLIFRGAWLQGLLRMTGRYDIVGYFGRKKLSKKTYAETLYLEFSCALLKREVFETVGMIDPIYRSGYLSDDDFCLRALISNYRLVQINRRLPPVIEHLHGQTYGSEERYLRMQEEFQTFVNRWSPRRGNRIVDDYFKRYVFNPFTQTYGEQPRLRRILRNLLPWRRSGKAQ